MAMTDAQAKAALRTWSLVTRIWSGGEYVYWLRAQPTDPGEAARAPRLTVPGSREFQTQPDGLWITLGVEATAAKAGAARFADCIVVEACGTAQNLSDKRARYSGAGRAQGRAPLADPDYAACDYVDLYKRPHGAGPHEQTGPRHGGVSATQGRSSRESRRRERIAENIYRRVTKAGVTVFEVVFRDVDGYQRTRRLDSRSERAAIREARAMLAGRDGGERVVAASLTVDELAQNEWVPLLDSLVAAGRRSERHTDDVRGRYRVHVQPHLGDMLLGDVEPRHVAALIRAMRARRPRPYAEATIANVLNVIRALYRLARSRGYVSRSPVAGLDSAELPRPQPSRRRPRARRGGACQPCPQYPSRPSLCRHAARIYRAPVVRGARVALVRHRPRGG
jgi:hypothetical protein